MHQCRTAEEALRLFDALTGPHRERLLAFAARRAPTAADAEDLVQEALLRAWGGISELREVTSLRPWLFRILRGVLMEHQRTTRRRLGLVPVIHWPDMHEAAIPASSASPFDALVEGISSQDLREALGRIPDEFAAAVELHDIHGLKYREVAEALEVPLGTVMSRISRGRLALARELVCDDSRQEDRRQTFNRGAP